MTEEKAISKAAELNIPFTFPLVIQKSYVTKANDSEDNWYIEGYAATSDFDLQGDIISPDCLKKSESQLLENSTVLFNHHDDQPIGRVVDSKVDDNGLFIKALISKTAPDMWQKITEGVLNKFSISARVVKAAKQFVKEIGNIANVIDEMQLLEVSLVSVPANPQAKAMNWYIGKALRNFEKEGGVIEMDIKTQNQLAEDQLDDQVSTAVKTAKAEDNIITDENGNQIIEKDASIGVGASSMVSGGAMQTAGKGDGAKGGNAGGVTTINPGQDNMVHGGAAHSTTNEDYNAGTNPTDGLDENTNDGRSPEASDQPGVNQNVNPDAPAKGLNKGLGWLLATLEDMDNYLESPDCMGVPAEVHQAIKSAIGAMSPAAAAMDEAQDAVLAALEKKFTDQIAEMQTKHEATVKSLTDKVNTLTKSMPVTRKGLIRSEEPGLTKGEELRKSIASGKTPEERLKLAIQANVL